MDLTAGPLARSCFGSQKPLRMPIFGACLSRSLAIWFASSPCNSLWLTLFPTLILLFCRLRLEASSANATTPHRRNLRANVLHLITAARRTFRLMTHDLLATFVYVAHFVFTEH